jgi:hypothetical protein
LSPPFHDWLWIDMALAIPLMAREAFGVPTLLMIRRGWASSVSPACAQY